VKQNHRKKIAVKVNVMQVLHHFLRTNCACTEHEIEILDAVFQQMVPMDDVDALRAIHEGAVTSSQETPRIVLDMGNGKTEKFSVNMNHPHMLLLEYLEKKYGRRFGTLYWFAFGSNPKDVYTTLCKIRHAPVFARLFSNEEVEA
jgi:hypothetical protein